LGQGESLPDREQRDGSERDAIRYWEGHS
jgi:hypothetical protein